MNRTCTFHSIATFLGLALVLPLLVTASARAGNWGGLEARGSALGVRPWAFGFGTSAFRDPTQRVPGALPSAFSSVPPFAANDRPDFYRPLMFDAQGRAWHDQDRAWDAAGVAAAAGGTHGHRTESDLSRARVERDERVLLFGWSADRQRVW